MLCSVSDSFCHSATFWSHVVVDFPSYSHSNYSKSSLCFSRPPNPISVTLIWSHSVEAFLVHSMEGLFLSLFLLLSLRMQYLPRPGLPSMVIKLSLSEHHSINRVPSLTFLTINNTLFNGTLKKNYSYSYSCQGFLCILISCIWLSLSSFAEILFSKVSGYFTNAPSNALLLIFTFVISVQHLTLCSSFQVKANGQNSKLGLWIRN